jgi:hypothetical protein
MVPNMCKFGRYRVQEVHLRRPIFNLLTGLYTAAVWCVRR